MASDPATVKFQQALPFSVFPVSSQLAALHAISQSSPVPDSCKSCGSYLTTHVTVVRNRRQSRGVTTTCNVCGRVHSTPLQKGNATIFPSRKRKTSTLHVSSNPIENPNSLQRLQSSFASSSSGTTASSGSSIKPSKPLSTKADNKKSRLHDMLKKNREKEQKRSNMLETCPGLSAFLTTL
ncbi:hypothetical protein BYT27DRAFT_7182940 [Phlegmacium glaucopus]|nr:hypothetical protein BYT27DRAFT_7182940 [Phlegmacium glaucopus]